MPMKPLRPITLDDLLGQPGLSRAASDALVAQQPRTVMQALVMHGVGRKTTRRLLALGLLTDPEGVQTRPMTLEELRATRREAEASKVKLSGGRDRSGLQTSKFVAPIVARAHRAMRSSATDQ
jgi:hypothetical protein